MCKDSLDRGKLIIEETHRPQVMCKNMLVAGRVLRQAHLPTIMTIDRDHPPDCTHLSKLRCATGQLGQPLPVAPAVPRVVLEFTWAVNHQRVGAESQVRSVRERRIIVSRFLRFGVREGSTGFEPQESPDTYSPFGYLTLIYMFCALVGWCGTIWRGSTDRSRQKPPKSRTGLLLGFMFDQSSVASTLADKIVTWHFKVPRRLIELLVLRTLRTATETSWCMMQRGWGCGSAALRSRGDAGCFERGLFPGELAKPVLRSHEAGKHVF